MVSIHIEAPAVFFQINDAAGLPRFLGGKSHEVAVDRGFESRFQRRA